MTNSPDITNPARVYAWRAFRRGNGDGLLAHVQCMCPPRPVFKVTGWDKARPMRSSFQDWPRKIATPDGVGPSFRRRRNVYRKMEMETADVERALGVCARRASP